MDQIVRDQPGPCPICGMPLVKRKKGLHVQLPEDIMARVQITPQRLALANIATTPVAYQQLATSVSAVGFIDYNQGKLFDLAAPAGAGG